MLSPGRPCLGILRPGTACQDPRLSWCHFSLLLPNPTHAEGCRESRLQALGAPTSPHAGPLQAETPRGLPGALCPVAALSLPFPGSASIFQVADRCFFERKKENTWFSITWKTAAAQPWGIKPTRTCRQGQEHTRWHPGPPPAHPRPTEADQIQRPRHPLGPRCLPAPGREDRWPGRCPRQEATHPCPPLPPQRALALAGCATWGTGFWGWRANT